ncbi:MAG: hypothetical protein J6L64_07770 [Opitutales bacterium]|nr:hypothetical protein [Opitutales bacterium]
MKIYIDTNTFPATPGVYADAAKTKPLPRVIPLVQGFRGQIEIAFLGELAPVEGSAVTLAMRPYGSRKEVLCTAPVTVNTETGEDGVPACASVSLAVNTDALAAAFADRETLNLLCGVIVTDDTAAFPTRVEWQLVLSVSASALDNGVPPDITPTAAEQLRNEIDSVKTDLAENYVDLRTVQQVLEYKSFKAGIGIDYNDKNKNKLGWKIDSDGIRVVGGANFQASISTNIEPYSVKTGTLTVFQLRHLQGASSQRIELPKGKSGVIALTDDMPGLQGLFSGHDGSNIDVGPARTFVTTSVDGGYFSGFQLSDFASRIFACSPGGSMNGFMAMAADGVPTNRVFGAPLQLGVPAENNDEATTLGQVNDRFTPLIETVPPEGNADANSYGFIGTLSSLGAFGSAVSVTRLVFHSRSSGSMPNPNVPMWARILKDEDDEWVVAAQSSNSCKWVDYGNGAEVPFDMEPVPGVRPPSAGEKVAIVLVTNPDESSGGNDGRVGCRCVSGTGIGGALTGPLGTPSGTVGAAGYYPLITLRFAPLSGVSTEEGDERWSFRKNPRWEVDFGAPISVEFYDSGTGGDFGIQWTSGGIPYYLLFPSASGTVATTSNTARVSKCNVMFLRHEASGGVSLDFDGINPSQSLIFPYYDGEDRTVATLEDLHAKSVTLADVLQGKTVEIDADLTNLFVKVFNSDGSLYCNSIIPAGVGDEIPQEILTKPYADTLYVPKSDYDALLARVDALEAAANG